MLRGSVRESCPILLNVFVSHIHESCHTAVGTTARFHSLSLISAKTMDLWSHPVLKLLLLRHNPEIEAITILLSDKM